MSNIDPVRDAELVSRAELNDGDIITPVTTRLAFIKPSEIFTFKRGKAISRNVYTRPDNSTYVVEEELPLHGGPFFRLKSSGFTIE